MRQLSKRAITLFKKKAVERGRLTKEDVKVSDSVLMEKLHLLGDDGNLVRAAMLAFHPDPEKWITGSYIKIGYFGKSDADLQYQDEVHGPLIEQIDTTVDLVYTKYMKALIDYEGIQRIEQFMFHKNAFRELLINAVVHKDYASCNPIQISVYADQIYIWNNGEMPRAFWSSAKLYKKHNSIPYNPKLAEVFFKSGMIEAWGRSFEKIREACAEYDNAPLPKLDVSEDGVMVHCLPCKRYVRLLKQNNNPLIPNERIMSELMSGKIGERLQIILNYLNTHDTINTEIAANITGKSASQAKRYLGALEKDRQIQRTKTTKGNAYVRI